MAQVRIRERRRLPYAAQCLADLVADVRRYPEFIPYLQRIEVEEGEAGLVASATVKWKAFEESFSTRVWRKSGPDQVCVSLVRGPLRTLENVWTFTPAAERACDVLFEIAFEFKNPIVNGLVSVNRALIAARIMGAFEAEAARRCSL